MEPISDNQKIAIWKGMFFRAQAGMERYLVGRFGYGAIDEWIEHSATASAKQSDKWRTDGAAPFGRNLLMIMQCWGSESVQAHALTEEMVDLEVTGCGILDYRKQARSLGIELTFDDPCREYCTKLLCGIARKQSLVPEYRLKSGGCRWLARRASASKCAAEADNGIP